MSHPVAPRSEGNRAAVGQNDHVTEVSGRLWMSYDHGSIVVTADDRTRFELMPDHMHAVRV